MLQRKFTVCEIAYRRCSTPTPEEENLGTYAT